MYFRSELIKHLVKEFAADQDSATQAVDVFIDKLCEADAPTPTVLLANESGDPSFEGEMDEDAEHVYSTQWYWDNQAPNLPPRGYEDLELPHEDKLIKEDGER